MPFSLRAPKSSLAVRFTLLLLSALLPTMLSLPAAGQPVHGAAMHGEPAYPPDFKHFAYVNPQAPKGGTLTLHAIGAYDTFNPFVVKGNSPSGIGLIYDQLTTRSDDEAFTQYGLLAERFAIGEKRDWVTFYLNSKARFSDGEPVTAQDVAFTYDLLTQEGKPFYRAYYADVAEYEIEDEHTITFRFARSNPELALILGQLSILPKHFWDGRDFNAALTEPPPGSGPYRIGKFDLGKSITYERDPDYWGAELPVNVGHYNFDRVSYTYFLDHDVAVEAFKSQTYDFRDEHSSINWATEYDFPALKEGRATKEEVPHIRPQGMQGFVFNTRQEVFADPLVREALGYAFDFEWSNANLFYGAYTRSQSFFSNSELGSEGLPSEAELQLLEPLRDQLPPQVFTTEYQAPTTRGGSLRDNLRKALQLLRRAGWMFRDGKLINADGKQLAFEVLLVDQGFVRIVNPMAQNLKRIGVEVSIKVNELTQYINRLNNFDFDMVVGKFPQSDSPGNEQRDFWGSDKADQLGSRNLAGVRDPAVDALIDKVIFAESREDLTTACRALDRALLWGHYVIPQYHIDRDRIAYWDNLERPEITPKNGVNILTWWTRQPGN